MAIYLLRLSLQPLPILIRSWQGWERTLPCKVFSQGVNDGTTSSPILPLTSGIGAVSPVNVGGPGSAEEAFRNEQGLLQRLFSGLGGGGNRAPSLSDISGGYYVDQRGAGSAVPAATYTNVRYAR